MLQSANRKLRQIRKPYITIGLLNCINKKTKII